MGDSGLKLVFTFQAHEKMQVLKKPSQRNNHQRVWDLLIFQTHFLPRAQINVLNSSVILGIRKGEKRNHKTVNRSPSQFYHLIYLAIFSYLCNYNIVQSAR